MTLLNKRLGLIATLALLPGLAQAHPGHDVSGLAAGITHPLMGMDHLLAMVAVGLCGAKLGGAARWLLPLLFVSVMLVGGALAMAGVHLPGVELGIVGSVIVLGALLVVAQRGQTVPVALLVAGFSLFHGYAHGAEMPASAGALSYALGFALATAVLHAAGLFGGLWLQERKAARVVMGSLGALISLAGVGMAVGV
ncbi:HupE/UreJ family protein [Pseudomonas aestusnigri]|uniref:HupE/UreJ family protein n=1 Tax=Halopseudomonas aestusnigri TaxID=857252 RepID=UPI001D185C00|nr:HupE/UreJ family protein [Halopseudomonas aestusnigri]MCC4260673.1 HupE/UreJ family protein [Halopseudomonas aestusnigri]